MALKALKIYNKENKSAWCVYSRKGTTEYDAVIKIMKSHKTNGISKPDIPIIEPKPDLQNPAANTLQNANRNKIICDTYYKERKRVKKKKELLPIDNIVIQLFKHINQMEKCMIFKRIQIRSASAGVFLAVA